MVRHYARKTLGNGRAAKSAVQRAVCSRIVVHGHSMLIHAAAGDVMLERLGDEFGRRQHNRYHLERLRGASNFSSGNASAINTVVDIGCNLGDVRLLASH